MSDTRPILFFDGVCALCNHFVRFLIERDPTLQFAPFQGVTAERILGADMARSLTTLLVRTETGALLDNSSAVFYLATRLRFPWRAAAWARVLPRALTDGLYQLVARARYKVFGRYETCRLPAAGERERFLD